MHLSLVSILLKLISILPWQVILEFTSDSTRLKQHQPTTPPQPFLLGSLSTYKLVTIVLYGVVRRYFHRKEFRRIEPFRMLPCLFHYFS